MTLRKTARKYFSDVLSLKQSKSQIKPGRSLVFMDIFELKRADLSSTVWQLDPDPSFSSAGSQTREKRSKECLCYIFYGGERASNLTLSSAKLQQTLIIFSTWLK